MDKITYNGEEYKDCLHVTTTYSPSFLMRLEFLFCVSTTVEHKVYAKDIVPQTKAELTVHVRSLIDKIKYYFSRNRGKGEMVSPQSESPCDTL